MMYGFGGSSVEFRSKVLELVSWCVSNWPQNLMRAIGACHITDKTLCSRVPCHEIEWGRVLMVLNGFIKSSCGS